MSLHSTSGQKAFATVRPATVLGIRLLAALLAVCGVAQPASAAGPTGKLTREENSGGTVGLAGKWILSQRTGIIPPLKDVVASLSGDRRFAEALAGLSVRTCVYRVSHADPEAHYYFLATQPDLDWVAARQSFSVGHWIHDIGPPRDQCPAAEADAARLIPGRQSPKYALHEARLPGPLGSRGQPGLATGCAWVQVTSDATYVLPLAWTCSTRATELSSPAWSSEVRALEQVHRAGTCGLVVGPGREAIAKMASPAACFITEIRIFRISAILPL